MTSPAPAIAPGVRRLRVPNPYFEGQNNVYLLEGEPLTLIDAGINTPLSLAALESGLHRLGYAPEELEQIVLTHKHLDHFGLARSLQERSGARVYIHQADWDEVAHFEARSQQVTRRYRDFLAEWGVAAELIDSLAFLRSDYSRLARSVAAEPLSDGQRLRLGQGGLIVIHTPGHTCGSACFQYGRLLFSGDHLLPDYTPNIGATDMESGHLLGQYLGSLAKIRRLAGIELVLPGHGEPISDIAARISAIEAHHRERSERILEILTGERPQTVYQIALQLFGQLRDHHVLLGCGEVWAHLEALIEGGQVEQSDSEPGRYLVGRK